MRRAPRVALSPAYHGVTVQQQDSESARMIEGHVCDLSSTGTRIELDEALEPGAKIGICINLPGTGCDLIASGRVVRIFDTDDDPGTRRHGIEFTRFLNDSHRRMLQRYVHATNPIRHAA